MLLWLLLAFVSTVPVGNKLYTGHQVWRIYFNNDQAVRLSEIISQYDTWSFTTNVADVRIPASEITFAKDSLQGFQITTLIKDLQLLLDREKQYTPPQNLLSDVPHIFTNYQDVEPLIKFYDSLPGTHKLLLNKTYEGNNINAFKFGTGKMNAIYIGGVHARYL